MGLLGTVIGMIEIFGSQAPATGGNPAQLAQGISLALYNTAFGLVVAIPALIFWRYFRAKVDTYLVTLETSAERLLRHLQLMRTP
jgi:biopolymer transport protein ExbB